MNKWQNECLCNGGSSGRITAVHYTTRVITVTQSDAVRTGNSTSGTETLGWSFSCIWHFVIRVTGRPRLGCHNEQKKRLRRKFLNNHVCRLAFLCCNVERYMNCEIFQQRSCDFSHTGWRYLLVLFSRRLTSVFTRLTLPTFFTVWKWSACFSRMFSYNCFYTQHCSRFGALNWVLRGNLQDHMLKFVCCNSVFL